VEVNENCENWPRHYNKCKQVPMSSVFTQWLILSAWLIYLWQLRHQILTAQSQLQNISLQKLTAILTNFLIQYLNISSIICHQQRFGHLKHNTAFALLVTWVAIPSHMDRTFGHLARKAKGVDNRISIYPNQNTDVYHVGDWIIKAK
jgi:hypothetical protein